VAGRGGVISELNPREIKEDRRAERKKGKKKKKKNGRRKGENSCWRNRRACGEGFGYW
jgi:hypothetical protein